MDSTYKRQLIIQARTLREHTRGDTAMEQAVCTTQTALARFLAEGGRDLEVVQTLLRVLAQAQPMGFDQQKAVKQQRCGARITEGLAYYVCVLAWDHDGGCLPSESRGAA